MTYIEPVNVIQMAGDLLSEDGGNYEYDRAIVELVHAVLGMDDADKDTTARLLRLGAGREDIGLVEPAAPPGLYLPDEPPF